ncbi:hypothetical protein [Serratia marcescens]|uniref:hypothetical protein n=1 Tax=Serratia marcescens TaxID=615 RepID=UPI0015747F7D|nr:hypothetical protein [Serratia marcescens]NSM15202.1 hypothetical protein [Serratia marcescens]NSM95618.1 hypothetical protein [Serratia marcescens]CAF2553414.1 hypothetical protein AI2872V1_0862 [Serratia marcescens]CAF2645758.1 hypothetical protein AI2884V1_0862 [Serratia marcescens]CAH5086853.1 hypothetical protein AI2872V1_0862 [Serratia marcescens]
MSKQPRLTEKQMEALALKTVQDFVNACNCKCKDDILLSLSYLLNMGLSAGETVKHGKSRVLQ